MTTPDEAHVSPDGREVAIATVCAIAAVMSFSAIPVVLKDLAGYLDSWTVNAVRYSTAGVFWLPFVIILQRRLKTKAIPGPARSIWLAALPPTAFNILGQIGWAWCPYYNEATTIAFVIRSSFLFTVLLGLAFIPQERAVARRPLFIIGAVGSLAGICMMYLQPNSHGSIGLPTGTSAVGMALIMATALCWGGYAVTIQKCLRGYPFRLAFGVVSLYTAGALVVLMLIFGDYAKLAQLQGDKWVLMIVSGLLAIALGHVLYYRGIHGIGSLVASGMSMLGPFVTYMIAYIVLDERLDGLKLIGGLVIVACGLMLIKAKAQTLGPPAPTPPAGK